ncbi:MAG: hypothetical protein ACRDP6_19570 [Actinoallomurus sp.]
MWLNFIVSIIASLCVGFILGWVVARPRRWGVFGADALSGPGTPGVPDAPGTPGAPGGEDRPGVSSFARRA